MISDFKRRPEGVRIKHRAGKNSLKMYNKAPTLLRVETTLNDGRGLKVYRHKHNDPKGLWQWLDLRKTVQDRAPTRSVGRGGRSCRRRRTIVTWKRCRRSRTTGR